MMPLSLWFAFLISAFGQNYIRVDSPADAFSYTIDLDAAAVQRALRPVTDAVVAAKLPNWLYPGPDFKPSKASWDPVTGVVTATFRTGGSTEQLSAFYDQALRAQGLRVTSLPHPGSPGLQITGSGNAATVTVQIQPQTGSIQVITTYAPRTAPRRHFEAVSYDDRTGLLVVRDTAAGGDYQLDKRGIVANNLNRPGAVASENAAMPPWLPVYPGAAASPKGRITWLFTPTAEFVTGDSIRQVYDYYLAQLRIVGAAVKSSGINRSGTPLKDFDAYVIGIKGDDQVEIRIGEVVHMGFPAGTSGRRTGIGIRYTVPKR
jgi:hypothetical protein